MDITEPCSPPQDPDTGAKYVFTCWLNGPPLIFFVSEWLLTGSVTQLVLAIISKDSRLPLERWVFDVHLANQGDDGAAAS